MRLVHLTVISLILTPMTVVPFTVVTMRERDTAYGSGPYNLIINHNHNHNHHHYLKLVVHSLKKKLLFMSACCNICDEKDASSFRITIKNYL